MKAFGYIAWMSNYISQKAMYANEYPCPNYKLVEEVSNNLSNIIIKSATYLTHWGEKKWLKFCRWFCKHIFSDKNWWISNLSKANLREFESCDRPIVRKRQIWVKIGDVSYRVTLKFDGWPWKTKGHLFFAVSSFVQHFIAIGDFKLELQSGNAQFWSNSTIFRAVWPCNLTYDLEKE